MNSTQISEKFIHPDFTVKGEPRAYVNLTKLQTLWFCTGTLCNLACENCYIESSPKNDRLVYLSLEEIISFLDEIDREGFGTEEIGFTGGEPFMNPEIIEMIETCLVRGYRVLVLTNAMRPMQLKQQQLIRLKDTYHEQLRIRVSVDHFLKTLHEEERGKGSWEPTIKGLKWLSNESFDIDVAGRTRWGEDEQLLRKGFADLFDQEDIQLDAQDAAKLVLFPEMDVEAKVPEITIDCWGILGIHPDDMMCASSRMVVKHKGADRPSVIACTLLPYEPEFDLGHTLVEASHAVKLNHPHCAKFCVLGGGSCSV